MFRFDSDYLEGCLPEILEAFRETNLIQTVGYGEDEYCEEAREMIKKACNAPEADVHFLVGGTQTNATVIASVLRPYQGVLCAESGHINVHETGAVEHTGHKVLGLPSKDGKIYASQVREALLAHDSDYSREHTVQPGMVYVSFPSEKGTVYSKSELAELSVVCREWGIPLFVDGARLGYGLCSPACGLTLPELASIADIFYIGGTKQGALFGEAVVFKNAGLSKDFRYNIKQNGGMLAKGRLLGIQFATLFRDGLYFRAAAGAVEKGLRIKAAFAEAGFDFLVDSFTNQQFPVLPDRMVADMHEKFGFEDWQRVDEGHTAVRFCTSWATVDEAVDCLINYIGLWK
ncbi:MAG: beta-eliminating lyase-related protein [Bacteroidales bacterium]|nr:beta-eliminating lyase-related protein [Bacteroidales bacterium]